MKKRMLVCLLSTLLCTGTFAQDYAFRVLINKGKNEIKSGSTWLPVKVGSSVKASDEIKVSENSYVGLVHATGKSMELKSPGTYKASELSEKIGKGTTVLNKYTDFILSNNDPKKNNLTATGAVHRGGVQVKVYLPGANTTAPVYGNRVIFNWDTEVGPGPYIVTFSSMFGDVLKQLEVNGSSVAIDLTEPSFENEDNFLVEVAPKSDPSKKSDPPHTIKKFSKADRDRIKGALTEIKDALAEPTAMNKLILAGFFEKNGLFVDAITAYQEAIQMAPDVTQFQEDYMNFLLRNKIKDPPVKK